MQDGPGYRALPWTQTSVVLSSRPRTLTKWAMLSTLNMLLVNLSLTLNLAMGLLLPLSVDTL